MHALKSCCVNKIKSHHFSAPVSTLTLQKKTCPLVWPQTKGFSHSSRLKSGVPISNTNAKTSLKQEHGRPSCGTLATSRANVLIFLSGSNKGATHRSLKPSPEWVRLSARSWSYIEREPLFLFSPARFLSHSLGTFTTSAHMHRHPSVLPPKSCSQHQPAAAGERTSRPRRVRPAKWKASEGTTAPIDTPGHTADRPSDLPFVCPVQRISHGALRIGTALFSPARDLAAEAEPLDQHGTVGSKAKCSSNKFQCANAPDGGRRVASARASAHGASLTQAALFIDFRQQHLPTHPLTRRADHQPKQTESLVVFVLTHSHAIFSHLLSALHWLLYRLYLWVFFKKKKIFNNYDGEVLTLGHYLSCFIARGCKNKIALL